MKFFSKLSSRERMFVYITALIIILFVVDKFIFSGMVARIDKLDERIEALTAELSDNKNIIAGKDKISRENEIYGKYLVKEPRPDMELSKVVDTLAIQSELGKPELKPVKVKETEANRFLIEVNAEGTMKNVINFMYNLNASSSLLKVERIDLSPRAAKSDKLKINILISKTVVQ
ncbi:MAG: hypothetical protein AB1599_00200 [Planctomycetota bacterium]